MCGSRILQTAGRFGGQAAPGGLGIAWVAATLALVIYLVRIDSRRLLRASAVVAVVAFLAACVGFVMGTGILEGATPRLGYGVQIGTQSGIAILVVGMVVAIARAAITA